MREWGSCFKCGQHGHLANKCKMPADVSLVMQQQMEGEDLHQNYKDGKNEKEFNEEFKININTVLDKIGDKFEKNVENENFCREIRLYLKNENDNFNVNFHALLDSGSPISFVKEMFIPKSFIICESELNRFHGLNNSKLEITGYIKAIIVMNGQECQIMLRVVPNTTMKFSIILGRDYLKLANLSFNFVKKKKQVLRKMICGIL